MTNDNNTPTAEAIDTEAVAELLVDFVAGQLISNGAVNVKAEGGRTPLHYAATCNAATGAKLLIDNGAKINAKDEDGKTPLHYAAICNAAAVAKLLIANDAEVKAKDNDGHTPLDYAEQENSAEVMKLLIENGATR